MAYKFGLRARLGAALFFVVAASHGALAEIASETTLTSSLNPSNQGDAVTFTAKVRGLAGSAPAATVTFKDNGSTIGSAVNVNSRGVGQTLAVAGDDASACVVTASGGVKCWGINFDGRLGDGSNSNRFSPVDLTGFGDGSGVKAVAFGSTHGCVIASDDTVWCWGADPDTAGMIGPSGSTTPSDVGLSNIVQLALGVDHSCALKNDGTVYCWGSNQYGQIGISGDSDPNSTPTQVLGLSGVTFIAASAASSCAILSDATVKCWGRNHFGQLGNNPAATNNSTEANNSSTPVAVSGLSGVVSLSNAGLYHMCAVTSGGIASCWGYNAHGQLGDGTMANSGIPVSLGLSNVVMVAGGQYHSCAVISDGSAKCWGWQANGRLGNGSTTAANLTPTDVTGLSGVANIGAGNDFSCAQITNGVVECWGRNFFGQLGDGVTDQNDRALAAQVSGMGTEATPVYVNAKLITSALAAAAHTITAHYDGDGVFAASTSADLAQQVNASVAPQITSVDHTTFTAGQANSFTITTNGTPDVTSITQDNSAVDSYFTDNGDGTATLSYSGSSGGVFTFTVTASNGVNPAATQTFTLTINAAPLITSGSTFLISVGVSINIPITTSGYPAPAINQVGLLPSGLTFVDNSDGTATLSGTPASGTVGEYPISLTASNGIGSDAAQSVTLDVIRAASAIAVTSNGPTLFGQAAVFTATVTGAANTPTGTVTFSIDGVTQPPINLNGSGVASLPRSNLTVADHSIIGVYNGDANYFGHTSTTKTHTVSKGLTTLTFTATPATVPIGASVTLKGTVHITAPASATPAGTVTFKDGSTTIGVASVSGGVGQFGVTSTTIGTRTVTATYSGDSHLKVSPTVTTTFKVSPAAGLETRANTFSTGVQQFPAIAKLKIGYFVAWSSNGQDGSGYGVYGQRYNDGGGKQGAELRISTATTGNQYMPKVAGLKAGGFIVTWQSDGQDGAGGGIYAQNYNSNGAKVGAEFRVNKTTAGAQTGPAIAPLTGGGFLIAWTGVDKAGLGIFAQRYDAAAKALGSEFAVNKTTTGAQSMPTIAALKDGGFLVAWQSDGQDGSGLGVYAQRYDAGGVLKTSEFLVNTVKAGAQSLPSAAGLPVDGGFVVTWQSANQDGSGLGVYMQRYNASAAKVGTETRVTTMTANDQAQPSVSAYADNGYIVLWTSKLQDGSGLGVYGQAFQTAGTKTNVEFLVNTTTANDQSQPAVAAGAAGNFMAAWTSVLSSTVQDIMGQTFKVH
jgi:alpha-tubulin suppressor-like RCC1 family protein